MAAKVARCYQNYHTYTITRNNYNLMICDDARELQKCEHTCFVPISQAAQTIPGLNGCGTLAPGSTGKILAAQVFPQDFLDLSWEIAWWQAQSGPEGAQTHWDNYNKWHTLTYKQTIHARITCPPESHSRHLPLPNPLWLVWVGWRAYLVSATVETKGMKKIKLNIVQQIALCCRLGEP